MKKQRYIVEIEMPNGDFISAGWLKELIQTDCDVEDESRKKVTVQETSIPSNLDEAFRSFMNSTEYPPANQDEERMALDAFKAGAEWMAGQGVTCEGVIFGEKYFRHKNVEMHLSDEQYDKVGVSSNSSVGNFISILTGTFLVYFRYV